MLTTFEDITQPINAYEMQVLLPAIVASFKRRVGKCQSITTAEIIEKMSAAGYKINGVVLRKIVHYIRENNILVCLVGTSEGYYLSREKKEIEKQIESLKSRENSIRSVRQKLEEQLLMFT